MLLSCHTFGCILPLICIGLHHVVSESKLSFCSKGEVNLVSNLNAKSSISILRDKLNCPGGLLFNQPVTLKALTAYNDSFCVKGSVCDTSWQCGSKKQSITAQIVKLGKPSKGEPWTLFENDASIDNQVPQCRLPHPHHHASRRSKRELTGLVPSERTSNDEIQREVDDQTKRMFYYLTGINQDQVNSHLRVVKLYKMSTQLVPMICDPTFVNPQFLMEIEKGFLFLLKEQGFDKLVDIDLESYNQLKPFLENCAANVTMIRYRGSSCPTKTIVEKVYTLVGPNHRMKGFDYKPDEKTFKWGSYDIVLDTAWSVMNIVHGGCFEYFSGNVNLHHKFQVALEQLFQAALYLRWEHPTQLADDTFYDSIFMTRVNDTMRAIDGCIRYLHLLTPFKVQLNRPIHETFYRRKKRSTASDPNEPIGHLISSEENFVKSSGEHETEVDNGGGKLQSIGYCLQNEEGLQIETESMKKSQSCN